MWFASLWLWASRSKGEGKWAGRRSFALRMREQKQNDWVGFMPRFKVFLRLNLAILSIPFRLKKNRQAKVLLLNVFPPEYDMRLTFVQQYLKDCPDPSQIETFAPFNWNDKLVYHGMDLGRFYRLAKACTIIWWSALLDVSTRNRYKHMWQFLSSQMLIQQILFNGPGRTSVVFLAFNVRTFISVRLACAIDKNYHPIMVSSNSILLNNNRYMELPAADIAICSNVVAEEIAYYRKMGWMKIRKTEMWGLEEVNRFLALKPTPPTVDIGVFSSGFWARTEDGYRISADETATGKALNNRWFMILKDVLAMLKQFKQDHPEVSIKIYPHPFELHLHREYGLEIPYERFVLEAGFIMNKEGTDSLAEFYAPRIAISTQSTILFDRLHYGLPGFYWAGKEKYLTIEGQYLGPYAEYGFSSMEELREKLMDRLGLKAE